MNRRIDIDRGANIVTRVGISVALVVAGFGLSGSIQRNAEDLEIENAGIKLVPVLPGKDIPMSARVSCKNDVDANTGVANPLNFTKRCINGDGGTNRYEDDGFGTVVPLVPAVR